MLGVLVGVPESVHELHPVLRPRAENLPRTAREQGETKVAARTAQDDLNLLHYILGNGGIPLKAFKQLEHVGSGRDEAGIRICLYISFHRCYRLSTAIYHSCQLLRINPPHP